MYHLKYQINDIKYWILRCCKINIECCKIIFVNAIRINKYISVDSKFGFFFTEFHSWYKCLLIFDTTNIIGNVDNTVFKISLLRQVIVFVTGELPIYKNMEKNKT